MISQGAGGLVNVPDAIGQAWLGSIRDQVGSGAGNPVAGGLYGGRDAPNLQAALGTLPSGAGTIPDLLASAFAGGVDPNADLLAAIRQGLGLGPINPAGRPLSDILGDTGGADPYYQMSEAQSAGRNQLISQGVGTALSLAAELADVGVPGIGFLASSLLNSFMAPGLSHESREANEIQGYQNFMGNQSSDLAALETPDQLLSFLRSQATAPYANQLSLGGLNLEAPGTTWDQIAKAATGGGQVTDTGQLGVRPGRIQGTSSGFANDIEAKILQLVGAQIPGAQGDTYREALDKAAAPRNFYYENTAGIPTWENGQYTTKYLTNPDAGPFTGTYGHTYSLGDFPALGTASANQRALIQLMLQSGATPPVPVPQDLQMWQQAQSAPAA